MKSQADIISVLLIVIIAIGLVATAYIWGLPLIQKRQDTAIAERVNSYFDPNNANSLPVKIESVANTGGELTFSLDVKGLWRVFPYTDTYGIENNSIEFTFFSKVTKVAADKGWVSLSGVAGCPPSTGLLGIDKSYVICAKASAIYNGYNITYKVWFRELVDTAGKNGFKIGLLQHPASSLTSTGQNVRMIFDTRRQDIQGQKTLIISQIKILLG